LGNREEACDLSSAGHTQDTHRQGGNLAGLGLGDGPPGTEVISIAGYPAGKAVGATTLNLVLFTGDENMGWRAAMPLS
jgi:hypothetical protein